MLAEEWLPRLWMSFNGAPDLMSIEACKCLAPTRGLHECTAPAVGGLRRGLDDGLPANLDYGLYCGERAGLQVHVLPAQSQNLTTAKSMSN
jgi:hypothetical protein